MENTTYKYGKVRLVREPAPFGYTKRKLTTSRVIAEFAREVLESEDGINVYETFWMISLNNNNVIMDYAKVGMGGIRGVFVDTAMVAKFALETMASGVALVHNHPSGSLKPSQPDLKLTKLIKLGLDVFDINLIDHLIVTEDSYFSFADERLI